MRPTIKKKMNGLMNIILAIVPLVSDEIFTMAAISSLTNNKHSTIQENSRLGPEAECKSVGLFCWYFSDNYDRKVEPWNHLDAKNESLPFF